MKIEIEAYNPLWPVEFNRVKTHIEGILPGFHPLIEHIGSTSVPGLDAKPIIDVLVGIGAPERLDETIGPMINNHFIYYAIFNKTMPERRLFLGLKDWKEVDRFQKIYDEKDLIPHEEINLLRQSHIHILEYGSKHWIRHIAFREYLKIHPEIRTEYAALKKQLSLLNWKNGMEYSEAKNDFIKAVERAAVEWYEGL